MWSSNTLLLINKFYTKLVPALNKNINLIELFINENIDVEVFTYSNNLNSSDSYITDVISYLIEYIFISEDQHLTKDLDRIYFCNKDEEVYVEEDQCKNITSFIYWLILYKKLKITKNHLRYLGLKIVYQKMYEYDEKNFITPIYIYKSLNTLLYIFIKNFKNKNSC
jgi:hypothetical protein